MTPIKSYSCWNPICRGFNSFGSCQILFSRMHVNLSLVTNASKVIIEYVKRTSQQTLEHFLTFCFLFFLFTVKTLILLHAMVKLLLSFELLRIFFNEWIYSSFSFWTIYSLDTPIHEHENYFFSTIDCFNPLMRMSQNSRTHF